MGNILDIPKIIGQSIARENPVRINEFQFSNLLAGYPLPPYPKGVLTSDINKSPEITDVDVVAWEKTDSTVYSIFGTPMCVPLKMKLLSEPEDAYWKVPIEPLITVSSENVVVKRNVAKMPMANKARRGTIKERWAQNDYSIEITGLLVNVSDSLYFPEADVRKLVSLCEAREPIAVECPLFQRLSIHQIVIEKWDLPFTIGPENQAYKITASSDDDWDLLVPKTALK